MTAISLEAARHSGCGVRWVINAKGGELPFAALATNDRDTQKAQFEKSLGMGAPLDVPGHLPPLASISNPRSTLETGRSNFEQKTAARDPC